MKKLMLAAMMATVIASLVPAHAKVTTVSRSRLTFSAIAPCSALCPSATTDDGCSMSDPTVPVSASDRIVKVPSRANFMIFRATPELDWDLVVCRKGKNLGSSANGAEAVETVGFYVVPGRSYRLRAWNWADVNPLPATLEFKRIA